MWYSMHPYQVRQMQVYACPDTSGNTVLNFAIFRLHSILLLSYVKYHITYALCILVQKLRNSIKHYLFTQGQAVSLPCQVSHTRACAAFIL